MNMDFLNETKLRFIAVKPKRFVIDAKGYSEIEAFIEDTMPVRKLFNGKKLLCSSNDGKTGKSGKHCALCRDRHKCRKRIRLMLMIQNIAEEAVPALLEINQQSFENFKAFIDSVEPEKISTTLVQLTVGEDEKNALIVLFATLF
jgi:hypothetical protein